MSGEREGVGEGKEEERGGVVVRWWVTSGVRRGERRGGWVSREWVTDSTYGCL